MNSLLLLVASNLAVACCIAVVAYSVGRWGKSAALAHLLWMAVFIKLITPPIVVAPVTVPNSWGSQFASVYQVLAIPKQTPANKEVAIPTNSEPADMKSVHSLGSPPNRILGALRAVTFTRILVAIWLVGTSLIFMRGVARYKRFSRLLIREGVIDDDATKVVARLLPSRTRFVPVVRRISARVSPMLFGVGRATCIVCPNRLWDQLNETQRAAFLAHEIAHFLRRDHWVRWLEWVVTAVYWWFPLVYIARQQLERHEEAACDAWAVSRLNAPRRVYAETLLNVVDFLSENRIGAPRLASRMQATDSLEERLRLIMSAGSEPTFSTARYGAIVSIGIALLLIHPIPRAVAEGVITRPAPMLESSVEAVATRVDSHIEPGTLPPLISLPPVPRGWWNEPPGRTWAEVRIGNNDLKLLAEAGVGVSLLLGNQSQHIFDSQSIRAIAHVASSGRLIIGNSIGELHLWDVVSSQAVSLIGRHPDCVNSLAYHPNGGLVSGDVDGNIMAWDIQSGKIRASTSVGGPVCSVRWAARGDKLAIVVGDWASTNASSKLLMLDGASLETTQSLNIPHDVALAQQHAKEGWLAVDWSGKLWSLISGDVIGNIPKESVSGVMLCQDVLDRIELSPIRPRLEKEDE